MHDSFCDCFACDDELFVDDGDDSVVKCIFVFFCYFSHFTLKLCSKINSFSTIHFKY